MEKVRILIVEDEAIVARDVHAALEAHGHEVVGIARTKGEALQLATDQSPDLILADIRLQEDYDGIEAAIDIRRRLGLPVIYLTAHSDEKTLERARQAEPYGYILKPFDERELLSLIEIAIYRHRMEAEVKKRDAEIRLNEARVRSLIDVMSAVVWTTNSQGEINEPQPSWQSYTGQSHDDAQGYGWLDKILDLDHGRIRNLFSEALHTSSILQTETQLWSEEAESFHHVIIRMVPVLDSEGHVSEWVGAIEDVHQQRLLEEQVNHTQKLESLGVLAGGIAHDFNNMLQAAIGYSNLALSELPKESATFSYISEIKKVSKHASGLCQQLLAYSGKGLFVNEVFLLSDLIKEMKNLLRVSCSKKIDLSISLSKTMPYALGDISQIRQIILNLVINASEAIGDETGTVQLRAGSMLCGTDFFEDAIVGDESSDGPHVFLEVKDSGCGMDKDTLHKIFDPFYSTKFTGRGLGLAAVIGIVRSHNGSLKVTSKKGEGTSFLVTLPATLRAKKTKRLVKQFAEPLEETGCILLVDDEKPVLRLGKVILERAKFKVYTARDGHECLETYKEKREEIDLVVLDLTMPRMSGAEASEQLHQLDPEVKILMTSGYGESEALNHITHAPAAFLKKPYEAPSLVNTIRSLLAKEKGHA